MFETSQFKIKALKDLLDVNLITIHEFEMKRELLMRRTEKFVDYTGELKLNQLQMNKLKEALENDAISKDEFEIKLSKLKEVELMIKRRFSEVQSEI